MTSRSQSIALTIGGSDSSSQAGVQADLRTFAAHEVHGLCAITALTIQDHQQVLHSEPIDPSLLRLQIDSMLRAFPVQAIKTSMLVSAAHVKALATSLVRESNAPIVVDPVLQSTSGTRLINHEGEQALIDSLLPLATVLTPNLPEAIQLTGLGRTTSHAELAAECAKFIRPDGVVILKGGHGDDQERSRDLIRMPNGVLFHLEGPRIPTTASRGTGCTFAAAITAGLANGLGIDEAARKAKTYISGALRHAVTLRDGRGPVNQLWTHPSTEGTKT